MEVSEKGNRGKRGERMTKEEAIKVIEMFLHKQCDFGRTEFAYDANTVWEAVNMARKALEKEPCEDVMAIHTQGLDECIRCAMCTNSMKSNRGCDGGCVVNEGMYKEVMNTIKKHIVPPVTPTRKEWIPVSERLPEKGEVVLCTNSSNDLFEAYAWDDCGETKWSSNGCFDVPVIAWMQLPEPYGDDEEKCKVLSEWQQDHAILKAHSDGANEVLDRIKAARNEIEGLCKFEFMTKPLEIAVDRDAVLQIIDQLIAEVEGKDATERK